MPSIHPNSAASISKTSKLQLLFTIVYTIVLIGITWNTVLTSRSTATNALVESSNRKLNLFVTKLTTELDKHGILPQVLAMGGRVKHLISQPEDRKWQQSVNTYLEYINKISGTSDIYVLNKEGTTVAASNWNKTSSFLKHNFSFRPYFLEAMKGKLGLYPALGAASNKRGYYFARPVIINDQVQGVVVVKITPEELETAWLDEESRLLVTDTNGVIFISNDKRLHFHTLGKLNKNVRNKITKSFQYANKSLTPLPLVQKKLENDQTVFMQTENYDDNVFSHKKKFLYLHQAIPDYHFKAHILADSTEINEQIIFGVLKNGALITLIFLGCSFLIQRHRNSLLEIQHQKNIEKTLLDSNKTLEQKVAERTDKLVETNRQLHKKIQQHKKSEKKVKETTDQLLQSAKLAVVGQMSAGLSHELSQPLTAIKSYLHTIQLMIKSRAYDNLDKRIIDIIGLTDRMAKLTYELRGFSRKSNNEAKIISLKECIQNAISLVQHAHHKPLEISYNAHQNNLKIETDPVQFEQVLINLLKNSVDATEALEHQKISVSTDCIDNSIYVSVRDFGTGIPEEHLKSMFNPFFTTKKSGAGLGLGLSISQEIIKAHGGIIQANNNPEGGAIFTIIIPHHKPA